jgi:hypothetical protein
MKHRISNAIQDDMNKGKNMRSCFIEKEKLQEENEILKDKVKHLENMVEILDTVNKGDYPDFESYNHKTYRNTDGNLITYYTK